MIASRIEFLGQELGRCRAAMQADLEALVQRESPTGDKAAVDAAGAYLADRLEWAGATVTRDPQPGAGDHLRAVWPGSARDPARQVLLLGHLDTVWPVGERTRRPARGGAGDYYGPGAFDMKAGLAMTLHVMRTLRDLDVQLKRDVVLVVNTDEETGSATSRALIEREARVSQAVLVLEPPISADGLTLGRKGVGRFTVHVQGVAAHAGRNPQAGASAIEELARLILDLGKLNDPAHGTTVNVGVVQGGTRVNVVASEASAEVDLRVVHACAGGRIVDAILGLQSHDPRVRVEIRGGLTRPPWEASSADEALFRRARTIGLHAGLDLRKYSSGGGSDGNLTAALGVPTLDGLGPAGDGAHAHDERVALDSLVPRATLLGGLLLDLGNNGGA